MKKSIHRREYEAMLRLLREARREAGMTQVELSEALGVRQSFVSDVERGVRRLDVIELRDFCRTLGRDLGAFLAVLEAEIGSGPAKRPRRHHK